MIGTEECEINEVDEGQPDQGTTITFAEPTLAEWPTYRVREPVDEVVRALTDREWYLPEPARIPAGSHGPARFQRVIVVGRAIDDVMNQLTPWED
jgi:hypothetical protein